MKNQSTTVIWPDNPKPTFPPAWHWLLAGIQCLTIAALVFAAADAHAGCSLECEFYPHVRVIGESGGLGIRDGLQGWQNPKDFPIVAPSKIKWVKTDIDFRQGQGVVLGKGHGYLTPECNLKDVCLKLAQEASAHHANVVSSKVRSGVVDVLFLRQ